MTTPPSASLSRRLGLLSLLAAVAGISVGSTVVAMRLHMSTAAPASVQPVRHTVPPAALSDMATQLRRRLASAGKPIPPGGALENALEDRRALLSRVTTATVETDGSVIAAERIALIDNAHWITLETTALSAQYVLDQRAIATDLERRFAGTLSAHRVAETEQIKPHDTADTLLRATLTERPSDGYTVDWTIAAERVADAVRHGEASVTLPARYLPASLIVQDASGATVALTLLATGRSSFEKSPWGRAVNVRKGLEERMDGTIIPQGAAFSFNDAIGPMSASRGWKEALGIFEGVNLKPIVGGGICQVATTVYRAALLAGLPIDARKNHSLYVTYYKAHGVGLDATVFPGKQDLTFRNDTPGPLFIESWTTDEDEGVVRIYGIPDGRSVALEGPFYSATAPETLTVTAKDGSQRALRKNEIAWQRMVTLTSGETRAETIVSTYNAVPKSLVAEALAAQDATHAAAPSVQ